jgi:hypothetical protein
MISPSFATELSPAINSPQECLNLQRELAHAEVLGHGGFQVPK